ncbi:MAG: histidine phosphatase family protein [Candidatus Limnocylindrales bacterium]
MTEDGRRIGIPDGLDATIVLLRHGESVHITEDRFQGRQDSPLSTRGEEQARLAAERLATIPRPSWLPVPAQPPIEVVHSPLVRAARSAELVGEAIVRATGATRPRRADGRLIELGQGRWEGRLRGEIEANDGDLLAAWRRLPLEANAPDGERVADSVGRVRALLADVIDGLSAVAPADPRPRSPSPVLGYAPPPGVDGPWTLLVGHDGIFKVILLELLDLPLDRFWTFPFDLCGFTVVGLRAGRGVLRAHNLTDHLAAAAPEGQATEPISEPNGRL